MSDIQDPPGRPLDPFSPSAAPASEAVAGGGGGSTVRMPQQCMQMWPQPPHVQTALSPVFSAKAAG